VATQAAALWAGQALPPLLSSFRPEALLAARKAAPHLPRALLLDTLWPGCLDIALELGCCAIVTNHLVMDAALRTRAREAGWLAMVYTVNEPDDARRMRDLDIDGVITDAVDRFAPALG
jgi:glycerophosphoryl diester phosphodiesterase